MVWSPVRYVSLRCCRSWRLFATCCHTVMWYIVHCHDPVSVNRSVISVYISFVLVAVCYVHVLLLKSIFTYCFVTFAQCDCNDQYCSSFVFLSTTVIMIHYCVYWSCSRSLNKLQIVNQLWNSLTFLLMFGCWLINIQIQDTIQYTACPEKNGPLRIMVYYSKYLANITEVFTTEFSTYLYIMCKNSWTFKVKIVFYYMFSITRPKHKFPRQDGLMHFQLSPMKQCDYSSIVVTFFLTKNFN